MNKLLLLFLFAAPLEASPPVVFTSSHIGSFYAFVRALPPDASVTLVQMDAHDDAMALTESRIVRRGLWKNGTVQESALRVLDAGQFIEGYNWIEPLMPHPIARMEWVAPKSSLADPARARVAGYLNLEVRRAGEPDLPVTFVEGPRWDIPQEPWILTVDLDYFAATPEIIEDSLRTIFRKTSTHPPLAVTFAVSEPYLTSRDESEAFVKTAWKVLLEETGWTITVNPRVSWGGRDRGQEARLKAAGRSWEEFDFSPLRPWAQEHGRGRIVFQGSPAN